MSMPCGIRKTTGIDTDIYLVYAFTKITFMHYHAHCFANFNNISVLVLSCRSVLLEQPVLTRAEENQAFAMLTVTYILVNVLKYISRLYNKTINWPV